MQPRAADICAALSHAPGGGSQLQLIARNALIRAGCEAGADPFGLATALGRKVLPDLEADFRAKVHGTLLVFHWHREDWALNFGAAIAMSLLAELGLPAPLEDVYRIVGYLLDPADPAAGSYLPAWFLAAYRHRSHVSMRPAPAIAR